MLETEKRLVSTRLKEYCERIGSQAKASQTMTGVSTATVSKILSGAWDSIGETMWRNVASQVGYEKDLWRLAETRPYKMLSKLLSDAQNDSLVMGIIGDAGSGKSETLKRYRDNGSNVLLLSCSEYWNRGAFVQKLLKTMGIDRGELSVRESIDIAIDRLKKMESPLLILDEADKLSDQVLYFFITLYNQLEDSCGIILIATAYLQKRIEKGLRLSRKGYEEIFSRMGRKFVVLARNTIEDIEAIAIANGIEDKESIDKIIDDSEGDLRRVKRLIYAYQKRQGDKSSK